MGNNKIYTIKTNMKVLEAIEKLQTEYEFNVIYSKEDRETFISNGGYKKTLQGTKISEKAEKFIIGGLNAEKAFEEAKKLVSLLELSDMEKKSFELMEKRFNDYGLILNAPTDFINKYVSIVTGENVAEFQDLSLLEKRKIIDDFLSKKKML